MGSEWVGVANDLFRSCRIDRRVERLSECGADAFVGLYESVLGEQVPDLIAAPRSQEDDAHNVQAVIDSLALDYLQVSLSHITGENIVKGDRESIRNLLEIFDGLLEYLTEEASESSSQNGDETHVLPNSRVQTASPGRLESSAGQLTPPSKLSSVDGSELECFVPSCDVDGSGSTSELIRLGDTARSFSERGEGSSESIQSTELPKEHLSSSAHRPGEPTCQAVPLLPPFQPAAAGSCDPVLGDLPSLGRGAAALVDSHELESPTMLKRALGGRRREEVTDEDSVSQHSDSIMDYHRRKAGRDAPHLKYPGRTRSLSPSSPSSPHQRFSETEGKICRDGKGQMKKIRNEVHKERAERKQEAKVVAKAYENELRIYEAQERLRLSKLKEEVKELVQQALKKHELLVAIIKKDQDHNKRLHEFKQRIYRQKWTQNKVREKRQQAVRARKYYEDYRVQLRARMMRARTREERIFKNLFEEGLEIQKQRLKDLRAYAQEMRAQQRREHQNELESMENYYRDQFAMLAEALSQERQEIQTREKAQAQMLQKTKRELRSRMEKEIQQLQSAIMQNDDETFFQELEADRLRARLQMASFQYNRSGFS
ncbi:hypothetical protein ASZ78_006583 [Callipepla squamata]|uniref:DUF5745 domain-containing protein n=1 Tax=Callipepla squamata TaxID=9009 RepID=A0A226NB61_CALSU|nr:hypothetical protein ASZ78_006583 [Callipepla squamata]